VLVLVTLPGALDVGIVGERPRGATASETTTKLRRHLEGARVIDVSKSGRAIRVSFERGGARTELFAVARKPYGAWWCCQADAGVLIRSPGASGGAPDEGEHLQGLGPETLRKAGKSVLEEHLVARRRQLSRALQRQIKRVRKKRAAIASDLERAQQADTLRDQANLLLAHAATIPRDADHLDAPSWHEGEPPIRIVLDPRRSPTEQAQDMFAKSKRLKRGLKVAPSRLRDVEAELAELESLRDEITETNVAEAEARLKARGLRIGEPVERARARRRAPTRLPYRAFQASQGATVLVGRGAADNDQLTLRVARPHDLWLHARGVTGAHVVVPLTKGKACPPEALIDAATLAAHFSDYRGEPVVDVLHTPRRFVRKRKGSPIGSVTLEREKVLAVRVEPERLARLLANEKRLS
jgi:predicted ribosome quality control (RQC) complex YloA/Tae2 family protein